MAHTRICIHVSEGFPILSLTLITEPLRVANRELGHARFAWEVVADQGGTLAASSGIPVTATPLPEGVPDAVVLLSSYHPDRSATPETLAWLRRLDRAGCLMGCVDTGALVFAKAGLLASRPAAAHPEAIAGFHRQFPRSLFIDRMHDFSAPRFSSAGGVATLDMTLALIGHFAGARTARRVAEILTYRAPEPGWQPQPIPESVAPEIRDAVAIMEAHLGQRIAISEIAARVGLPVWRLTRLFKRHLHATPTGYFVARRLARARDMLRNTRLGVGEIASDCGYDNLEVFSRAYRARFGLPPSQDRDLATDTGLKEVSRSFQGGTRQRDAAQHFGVVAKSDT